MNHQLLISILDLMFLIQLCSLNRTKVNTQNQNSKLEILSRIIRINFVV